MSFNPIPFCIFIAYVSFTSCVHTQNIEKQGCTSDISSLRLEPLEITDELNYPLGPNQILKIKSWRWEEEEAKDIYIGEYCPEVIDSSKIKKVIDTLIDIDLYIKTFFPEGLDSANTKKISDSLIFLYIKNAICFTTLDTTKPKKHNYLPTSHMLGRRNFGVLSLEVIDSSGNRCEDCLFLDAKPVYYLNLSLDNLKIDDKIKINANPVFRLNDCHWQLKEIVFVKKQGLFANFQLMNED